MMMIAEEEGKRERNIDPITLWKNFFYPFSLLPVYLSISIYRSKLTFFYCEAATVVLFFPLSLSILFLQSIL